MPDTPRKGLFATMILSTRIRTADRMANQMSGNALEGDLFQDAVEATVMIGVTPVAIAEATMVPTPTVKRWLDGKSAPDAAMRVAVGDLLVMLLRNLSDELRAELGD